MLARKLIRAFPDRPGRRYSIFAGTNTASEWRTVCAAWLRGSVDEDDAVVAEYERRFAATVGTSDAVGFGAGRMALFALLDAMGIGEGAEVVLPAFTCVVVPNAILYRGARPVFVDIDPRTFNIDPVRVEAAITPRTRAILAQHTFGVPCDLEALRDIGRRRGVRVIEDACHALGATIGTRPAGSLADAAFFSTDHSKVINTHLGGVAVTSDPEIGARLRRLQQRIPRLDRATARRLARSFLAEYACFSPGRFWYGRSLNLALSALGFHFHFLDELDTTRPTRYPYPARLTSIQARLGLSQLLRLGENLAHRRATAAWLEKRIGWYGMSPAAIEAPAWLRYSFLVRDRAAFEDRFRRTFDLGVWFTSVVQGRREHLEAVGYERGSCPVAERAAEHIVNFPTHPRIPVAVIQREVERNWSWLAGEILPARLAEPADA